MLSARSHVVLAAGPGAAASLLPVPVVVRLALVLSRPSFATPMPAQLTVSFHCGKTGVLARSPVVMVPCLALALSSTLPDTAARAVDSSAKPRSATVALVPSTVTSVLGLNGAHAPSRVAREITAVPVESFSMLSTVDTSAPTYGSLATATSTLARSTAWSPAGVHSAPATSLVVLAPISDLVTS